MFPSRATTDYMVGKIGLATQQTASARAAGPATTWALAAGDGPELLGQRWKFRRDDHAFAREFGWSSGSFLLLAGEYGLTGEHAGRVFQGHRPAPAAFLHPPAVRSGKLARRRECRDARQS
jgi:hypothetical protein